MFPRIQTFESSGSDFLSVIREATEKLNRWSQEQNDRISSDDQRAHRVEIIGTHTTIDRYDQVNQRSSAYSETIARFSYVISVMYIEYSYPFEAQPETGQDGAENTAQQELAQADRDFQRGD